MGVVAVTSRTGGRERIAEIVGAGRSFYEAIMFLDKRYIVAHARSATRWYCMSPRKRSSPSSSAARFLRGA